MPLKQAVPDGDSVECTEDLSATGEDLPERKRTGTNSDVIIDVQRTGKTSSAT